MKPDSSPEVLLATLRRFALERHRYVTLVARSLHMTRADFDALDYLEEAGGQLTPAELAHNLCLTTGSVTALIDRLEKAGLVTRAPNPPDRRSILVRLSKKSEHVGRGSMAPYVRKLMAAADGMTPKERASTVAFLDAATAALLIEP